MTMTDKPVTTSLTVPSPNALAVPTPAAVEPIELVDAFADASLEMDVSGAKFGVAASMQAAIAASLPPLTAARTVYVDSATGLDTNPGTSALPFLTLMRAWAERQKYGALRARFTIQLVGAGPYTVTTLGASVCELGGYLDIRGDTSVETSHATGTFTGDFSGMVVGTSAGLGVDTWKNKFVRVTSGTLSGAEFQILEHTDTTLTPSSKQFRTAAAAALVNGDTFKVYTPATAISACKIDDWYGGDLPQIVDPRHIIRDILFSSSIQISSANLALLNCRVVSSFFVSKSTVITYLMDAVTALGAAATYHFRSAGVTAVGGSLFTYLSTVIGLVSGEASISVQSGSIFNHMGGRTAGVTVGGGANYFLTTNGSNVQGHRIDATISVDGGYLLAPGFPGLCKFAVTSGNCLRIRYGGRVSWQGTAATGGTSDAAGYGVDCTGGGQYVTTSAHAVTGGTSNKDLKTSNNGGVANAVLSAAGTAAGVAADALLGEVLCRVA